jgi:hypothetical protein
MGNKNELRLMINNDRALKICSQAPLLPLKEVIFFVIKNIVILVLSLVIKKLVNKNICTQPWMIGKSNSIFSCESTCTMDRLALDARKYNKRALPQKGQTLRTFRGVCRG